MGDGLLEFEVYRCDWVRDNLYIPILHDQEFETPSGSVVHDISARVREGACYSTKFLFLFPDMRQKMDSVFIPFYTLLKRDNVPEAFRSGSSTMN